MRAARNILAGIAVMATAGVAAGEASAGPRDLTFRNACAPGTRVTVAAVGDVMFHKRIQMQGYASAKGFLSLWGEAAPALKAADIAFANLEAAVAKGVTQRGRSGGSTRAAYDEATYSGYPLFNAHPVALRDLARAGVDVVSTANNHSLDRFSLGVDRTIEGVRRHGMRSAGSRSRADARAGRRSWSTVTTARGVRVGWVGCTFGTNGIADPSGQVLLCYRGNQVAEEVRRLRSKVDAVIVTPHWGREYSPTPDRAQRSFAKRWLEAGASAVIGAHPHTTQPWTRHRTRDGRDTFIVYSLGNFVSNQGSATNRTTGIVYLGLTKTRKGTVVNGVRYRPAYMVNRGVRQMRLAVASLWRIKGARNFALARLRGQWGAKAMLKPGERLLTNPQCGGRAPTPVAGLSPETIETAFDRVAVPTPRPGRPRPGAVVLAAASDADESVANVSVPTPRPGSVVIAPRVAEVPALPTVKDAKAAAVEKQAVKVAAKEATPVKAPVARKAPAARKAASSKEHPLPRAAAAARLGGSLGNAAVIGAKDAPVVMPAKPAPSVAVKGVAKKAPLGAQAVDRLRERTTILLAAPAYETNTHGGKLTVAPAPWAPSTVGPR